VARAADPDGRERILTAAARLFYARGVRAVGMAEVIQAAGCGKNMLYRYFPSKSALAAAYLTRAREQRTPGPLPDGPPAERLVAVVAEVAAWVRGSSFRGCAFRNYLREFPAETDEPATIAHAYLRDTRRQIDDLVAELDAPARLADRVWLLIDGLYAGTQVDPSVAVDWVRELVDSS
jgi:AcrR family transcriptional regulator